MPLTPPPRSLCPPPQVLHPLQQRFLNLINQDNFAQISQEEAVKREIVATLEALCGIAEATQIDNVASLFSFLMDFLSSCIGLMEVGAGPCLSASPPVSGTSV